MSELLSLAPGWRTQPTPTYMVICRQVHDGKPVAYRAAYTVAEADAAAVELCARYSSPAVYQVRIEVSS